MKDTLASRCDINKQCKDEHHECLSMRCICKKQFRAVKNKCIEGNIWYT